MENTKRSINSIEKIFASDKELDIKTGDELFKNLVAVIKDHDKHIELLQSNHAKK
jgi:hypothetical protein